LEVDVLVKYLDEGNRMRPMKIEGATAGTRWQYEEWLLDLGLPCARQLESLITKLAVSKAQERFGDGYVVADVLASAMEDEGEHDDEQAVEVLPRVVATWDEDCVHDLAEELELCLDPLVELLEAGHRMKPYELLNATATTRWEYWHLLVDQGLEPLDAHRVEKAIARSAVLHVEDVEGPGFEAPEAIEEAFDDDDDTEEEANMGRIETWSEEVVHVVAKELELDLTELAGYLAKGCRMRPFDVEAATQTIRWEYVAWLTARIGLSPMDAQKLEKFVAGKAVENMQEEYGLDYAVPSCLDAVFFDLEPEAIFDEVGTWTAAEAEKMAEAQGIDMKPFTEFLKAGNQMRPIELDGMSLMTRWEYWRWLDSFELDAGVADTLEKAFTEMAIRRARTVCGEECVIPGAALSTLGACRSRSCTAAG